MSLCVWLDWVFLAIPNCWDVFRCFYCFSGAVQLENTRIAALNFGLARKHLEKKQLKATPSQQYSGWNWGVQFVIFVYISFHSAKHIFWLQALILRTNQGLSIARLVSWGLCLFPIYPSPTYLFLNLSIYLFVCLFWVCLSIHLSSFLPSMDSGCLSTKLSKELLICLCMCLSI